MDDIKTNTAKSKHNRSRQNLIEARKRWPAQLDSFRIRALKELTEKYRFSVPLGDLIILEKSWYVTHTGLIRLARRSRCAGIQVEPVPAFSEPSLARWSFKATVYRSATCRGFCGFGDADPSNVSPLVRGSEMRVAETRAVNRALRKAYGIGICSIEEIGSTPPKPESSRELITRPSQSCGKNGNGNGNGSGPRVRDRLCQLIRQHQLDADLVKAYAVDYCSVSSLKEASRAQVEQFVQHLAEWAARDHDALLCQLNSYPRVEQSLEQKEQKEGVA